MKKVLAVLVSFAFCLSVSFAEFGTVGISSGSNTWLSPVNAYTIVYTGSVDAVGGVSKTLPVFAGELVKIQYLPFSLYTNNYALTLKDSAGYDVACGSGATVTSNATFDVFPMTNGRSINVSEPLTLDVTGIGSNRAGRIRIFVRP